MIERSGVELQRTYKCKCRMVLTSFTAWIPFPTSTQSQAVATVCAEAQWLKSELSALATSGKSVAKVRQAEAAGSNWRRLHAA